MKFKSTYFIGLVFLALGAYVYFYEILGEEGRLLAEEEKNRFIVFEVDDVVKVNIDRPDATMSFEKRGDIWFMTEPVEYKADVSNLRNLLDSFRRSDKETHISDIRDDHAKYNLDAAASQLTITLNNDSIYSILVGNENTISEKAYARISGDDDVYLTLQSLRNRLNEEILYFRDKDIVDIDRDDVIELVYQRKNERIVLQKDEKNDWNIVEPIDYDVDDTRVTETFNRISLQKIKDFTEDSPQSLGKYGLDKPNSWLEMSLGDSSRYLYFGNPIDGNYYVTTDLKNPVIELDSSTVHYLTPRLFDLRDKDIVDYSTSFVDEVHITKKDSTFIFTKEKSTENWYMTDPDRGRANKIRFENILNEFYVNKAIGFIDNPAANKSGYGLSLPVADYVMFSNGEEIEHIQIGKEDNDKRYFYNVTKEQMFLLKTDLYPQLFVPVNNLLEPQKE